MRRQVVTALFALGVAASPALADSLNSTAATGENSSSSSEALSNPSPGRAGTENGMQNQSALKKSLQQAGFKDIQISATSYVVHAKGPDGAPIVMMITPDSVAGVVANPQSAQVPNSGAGADNFQTAPQQ